MKIENLNPIRNLKKLFLFAAMLACCGGWTKDALARSTCWCEIASSYSTGEHDTAVISLTNVVNTTYCAGPGCVCRLVQGDQCDAARADCSRRCNIAAGAYRNNPGAFCAKGTGGPTRNGVTLRAYSHVGTRGWEANDTIGTLTNKPAVSQTTCTCPRGWTCNGCSPQTDGGVTTDGKCKKLACQPDTISPPPPDGTQIGTWGFSWGNAFIAWGTAANGGAPVCRTVVISPAVCKF